MNDRRYIPVLKYKSGELWALNNIHVTSKRSLVPLIEMHRDDVDGVELIDDLITNWPGLPAFVETESHNVLMSILDEAASQSYPAIPVTRLLRQPVYQTILASHPHVTQHGLMLRLAPSDFTLQGGVTALIQGLLIATNKREPEIDLLIDLGQVLTPGVATAISLGLTPQLPNLSQWRSFTISSAGFPTSTSVQGHPTGAWHFQSRHDWHSWLSYRSQATTRLPDFSDYTVREPDFPPGFAPKYVTIRYTTDNSFMIRRETKSATPPVYSPAISICRDLIARPEYRGQGFSEGDRAIQQRATTTGSPGSPAQWIREAVNHHIEVVVDAIANLP